MKHLVSTLILLLLIGSQETFAADCFSENGLFYAEKTKENFKVWNIRTGEVVHTVDITQPISLNREEYKSNFQEDYKILGVSYTGRYIIVSGKEDFEMDGEMVLKNPVAAIDMQEGKVVWSSMKLKVFGPSLYYISPNSDQFVKMDIRRSGENYTNRICRIDLNSDGYECLVIDTDKNATTKGYDAVRGTGRMIEKNGKTCYVHVYTRGAQIYDVSSLNEETKPIKLRLTKDEFYEAPSNPNFDVVFRNNKFYENGKALKNTDNFEFSKYKNPKIIAGTSLVVEWHSDNDAVRVFDYKANKYTDLKVLFTDEPEWKKFSPDGQYLLAKFPSGIRVYDLILGEMVSELIDDEGFISLAYERYEKGEFTEAISLLNKVSESGKQRTDYHTTAYRAYGANAEYEEASAQLAAMDYKIPIPDYYTAARYLSEGENHQAAADLLWEYQKYDIRVNFKELEKDFPLLDGNESFELLVAVTKTLDEFSGEFTPEIIAQFDKYKVGMYELRVKEAYHYLNDYANTGLEDAFSNASYSLKLARENYALTPNGKGATYCVLGNAYMKTNDLVESYEQYNLALSVDTTVGFYYIELATVCQAIKGVVGEELRTKKQVSWPEKLRREYVKMDRETRKLMEAYMEKFPEDPFGYYLSAMEATCLIIDHHEKRMDYAKTAIRLFREQNIEVPEYCVQLADRYYGFRHSWSESGAETAPAPAGCTSKCSTCGGSGSENSSERCTTCLGSGKRGSCSSCNGRGRKYDTTRNQQVCYRCSGTGKLGCYSCNSTGRKKTRTSCNECSGSGYDCD